MPKLERWIIASKRIDMLGDDTRWRIELLGGQLGGGWDEVHQHICVNEHNKEAIERLLRAQGFTISTPAEHRVYHPECQIAHDVAWQRQARCG